MNPTASPPPPTLCVGGGGGGGGGGGPPPPHPPPPPPPARFGQVHYKGGERNLQLGLAAFVSETEITFSLGPLPSGIGPFVCYHIQKK
jgi:hypothetical protein